MYSMHQVLISSASTSTARASIIARTCLAITSSTSSLTSRTTTAIMPLSIWVLRIQSVMSKHAYRLIHSEFPTVAASTPAIP